MWFWDRLPFLAQSIEMEGNGLSHVLLNFLVRPASRNTSGKIRGISRKTSVCRLDND